MRQQYLDAIVALETCEDASDASSWNASTGLATSATGQSEQSPLYTSRSNEGGMVGRSQYASAAVDTSVISTASGYADAETATHLAHFALTPQQRVLLRAFHVLRALAIDLRLFVVVRREFHY